MPKQDTVKKPYGAKKAKSGQGKGSTKKGPRYNGMKSQVKTPMRKKANTVTKGGANGITSELDKGLGKETGDHYGSSGSK